MDRNTKSRNHEVPKMKVSKTQKLQSRADLGKVVKLKDFLNIDCYERGGIVKKQRPDKF
jgi:hypothetical protein